ncbi:MAG: class I SAM-dependent methyltransferase [Planctomycetota bacterium]|nr:class I SAM-dependent methyltransferase [Planctomycetota bacterium]
MQSAQFQLHAEIEDRHWWFVARRRIVRSLIDQVLARDLAASVVASNDRTARVLAEWMGRSTIVPIVDALITETSTTHTQTTHTPASTASISPSAASIALKTAETTQHAVMDTEFRRPISDRRPLIIDVGCGTGANIASLADRYRCVGIDSSQEAIDLAKARFPQAHFQCGYAPNDLMGLMPQASLVTMMDVLEHVEDDFALLTGLLSAMQPGAYLLLTVPADLSLWSEHDESFGHYRRYDQQRLEQLWNGLPVTPLLVSHYNTRLYRVIKASRRISRWRKRSAGKNGTDFRIPSRPVNKLLEGIFAGERERLSRSLLGEPDLGYGHGVSLIAILRREAGEIAPVSKPANIAADYFDPVRKQRVGANG